MEIYHTLPKKIELERPPQGIEKEKLSGLFKKFFERIRMLSDEVKENILNTSSRLDRIERTYILPKRTPQKIGGDILVLSADAQKQIHEKIQEGKFKLAHIEKKRSATIQSTDTAAAQIIDHLNEQRCADAAKRGTEIPEYVRRAIVQQRAIRQSRASRSGQTSLGI